MKTEQLNELKDSVLRGMREYMEDVVTDGEDPDYSESDIEKCDSILTDFLEKIRSADHVNAEFVMGSVKEAVLALNLLNESCEHSLIETDQREQICDLIIQAAVGVGVGTGEDITEEWRDW